MKDVILASASPRRQQLLKQIGVNFRVIPSTMDEVMNNAFEPSQVAISLAKQKCNDVASQLENDCIVIGADTIVVKGSQLLGKPKNEEEAFDMLKSLNGEWHEVITGLCLYRIGDKKSICDYEATRVKMASNSDEFLKAYIGTKEPFDKAGAYGIQGFGALIVEKIEGCYFNVMGLPIHKLSRMLDELGYKISFENLSI